MKKQKQKAKKKKSSKKKSLALKKSATAGSNVEPFQEKAVKQEPVRIIPRKVIEKKVGGDRSVLKYISKVGQFLRESKIELKKVKWPTRKELLASTAVVIVLTLVVAFFLGIVDFGLIKIIRGIVG